MRRLAWTSAITTALVAAALLGMSGPLGAPVEWTPDGLFYQARALEFDGAERGSALREVFGGPLAERLRGIDPAHTGNPDWVAFHARFYERRVTLPLAAAALEDWRGDRALLDLSIAGYVAAVLGVFVLLRLRFHAAVAGAVALLTVALPALALHSGFPQTDSWGLALETLALAAAFLAFTRGPRWIGAWAAVIVVLSFTRESVWVPVLGAGAAAVFLKSRVGLGLFASGVVAATPAMVLFPVSMRDLLATMLNGTQPVADASWSFVAEQFPGAVVDKLHADGGYVLDGAWLSAGYLLAGVALLVVLSRGRREGEFGFMLSASAFAGAAYVLAIPVFSAFRLELALVPQAAFGLALAAERAALRMQPRRSPARPNRTGGIPYAGPARDIGSARR